MYSMLWIWVVSVLLVPSSCVSVAGRRIRSVPELVYEWTKLDYDWISQEQKFEYIKTGKFIVTNNTIAGVKVWKDDVYVTVPRWRDGVPSTLNKVVIKNNTAVLQPYPSWEMQTIGDLTKLQYIQSMEIDSRGWMWILDVARINLQGPGQPKLIIWDIEKNCSVRNYAFPDSVFPFSGSFANDIVVDETAGFAYISDTWGQGGIVVYDFFHNTSRRFGNDPSLLGNASNYITINNRSYHIVNPTDGIALSYDTDYIYYCSLARQVLYSVPTFALTNFQWTDAEIGEFVVLEGLKGYSDGMTYSDTGVLFYASLERNAVQWWQTPFPFSPSTVGTLVADNINMQWADTFAWDQKGYIYFSSNRLQKFLFGEMKFDGSEGPNFRIWKVFVGMSSYLTGNPEPPSLPCLA